MLLEIRSGCAINFDLFAFVEQEAGLAGWLKAELVNVFNRLSSAFID